MPIVCSRKFNPKFVRVVEVFNIARDNTDVGSELALFRIFHDGGLASGSVSGSGGLVNSSCCLNSGDYASSEERSGDGRIDDCSNSSSSSPFKVYCVALIGLIAGGLICSVKGIYSERDILIFGGTGAAAAAALILTPLLIYHFSTSENAPASHGHSCVSETTYGRTEDAWIKPANRMDKI